MNEKSTSHLESMLKAAKGRSFNEYRENIAGTKEVSLCDYLNSYISTHNLVCSKVKKASLLSKDYADGIFNGHKSNPSRDRVIAITRAMKMDYDDTQRTLKIANVGALYPKVPRDFSIIYAIEQNYSVEELNDFLVREGFNALETQKKEE